MAPHFDANHFISCEDMLPISNSLRHYHNPACTLTGIIILAMPYQAWKSAKIKTGMQLEVKLYLLSLAFLFYLNLQQHWTATCPLGLDLDLGGALHTIFLSLMIWEHGGSRQCFNYKGWNNKIPTLSKTATRGLAGIASLLVFWAPFGITDRDRLQAFSTSLGGLAALTVVPVMGYLSWKGPTKSNFIKWVLACVGVKAAETLVAIEKNLICNIQGLPARWFHAIAIHAEIWFLFWAVSETAFGIIQEERRKKV